MVEVAEVNQNSNGVALVGKPEYSPKFNLLYEGDSKAEARQGLVVVKDWWWSEIKYEEEDDTADKWKYKARRITNDKRHFLLRLFKRAL